MYSVAEQDGMGLVRERYTGPTGPVGLWNYGIMGVVSVYITSVQLFTSRTCSTHSIKWSLMKLLPTCKDMPWNPRT